LHFEGGNDPTQLSVPQLSCEPYTYIESGDGVIHVEEEEISHLEAGGPVLESRPSYHIEDGVIVVEDDDDVEIENHSIPNTITHVEDDQDYSYSADEDETDFNRDDSMGRGMRRETDNKNSLQDKRKSELETIVSRKQFDREILLRSARSSMHSSGSISTKESGGLNKNKAELEFVVPGVMVTRNKKANFTKAVTWLDHCGALPCGLASF
jgi:hypothetical protein